MANASAPLVRRMIYKVFMIYDLKLIPNWLQFRIELQKAINYYLQYDRPISTTKILILVSRYPNTEMKHMIL